MRQSNMAGARDIAVQKLRDVTTAIVIAAAAGVGVIAWVSAATIPGSNQPSSLGGNAATGIDNQPAPATGGPFAQGRPSRAQFGPGVAVSGGSR
jgi:hypothetical protein